MVTEYKVIYENPFLPVQVDELVVGASLPFDIFVRDKSISQLLFNKETRFTKTAREILKEKDISEVYIRAENSSLLTSYLSKIRPSRDTPIDSTVFKEYSSSKEKYYQIDRNLLFPGTEINFSLFVLNKLSIDTLVKATENSYVKVDERILNVTGDIVIKNSDIPLYNDYIHSLLNSDNTSELNSANTFESDRLKVKALTLKENSKIVIKNFLNNPRSGEKIKEIKTLVDNMIDCILENRDALYNLLSLKNHDYYSYTHSVNVAGLSIGLGVEIDLKRDDIERLGIGTMLHDIGKSAIPQEILNKQGKLTPVEYKIIKTHVLEGAKVLRTHKEIPEESFHAVLQHHERLSGNGYPFKLSGDEIKLFGRISAIIDSYDALTTQRPYRPAYTPFYALSIATKETGSYDPELLKTFIKMLGKVK